MRSWWTTPQLWFQPRRPPWTLRRCSCNGCLAGSHVAVLADVGDTSLLHVVPWTGCHVATASPPCPPWSRASSRDGLEVFAGVCFLETMLWAWRAAPLALLMECVDALPVHPHYPIILAFIRWAGFTVHTTMLHNHAVFGPCTRRPVLIRHDVDLPPSQPVGLFQDPSPVPWTHECSGSP